MNTQKIEIPEWAFEFHGHKCPAMPIGYRAGLTAMNKLGVEKSLNKELYLFCENGPAHAAACFLDGVMAATGCTYGKGNAEKLNYGKNAIVLVDLKTKNAVRVSMQPAFFEKALNSEFVQLRKQKVEPKDIKPQVVMPLIENAKKMDENILFSISDIFEKDVELPKGTFEWHHCAVCKEVVFDNRSKVIDGKRVCIPCSEK
ncbi:FmdE family protein [Maribacter polysaccharolyticus]|uniref:FmdE family protein n=1 Tax=Maribacter polysaccharolyticus TaxID=3020831 RepID=UPI00237FD2F6|nr:FmdE family protein [Maribacter polysaccharolyticus]MDE3740258.1 FmdE family protein [Maribacter polysaccharolyticus]